MMLILKRSGKLFENLYEKLQHVNLIILRKAHTFHMRKLNRSGNTIPTLYEQLQMLHFIMKSRFDINHATVKSLAS